MRLANRFILLGLAIFAALASSGQYVQPMRYDHYAITQQASIGAGVVRVTAPSAYLEIGPTSGATKGLLGPRLTTTERNAIASPADGLLIYNTTTKKYNYYDGGSSSWKDIGSGSAGGGITQLGTSPWGLAILDDSTYLVDSMKVLTKYQGEKTRDSLAVLINLKLAKSDSLTGGNPTGFVTKTILNDSLLTRLKTAQAVPFDTTGAETGDALIIDRTGGDTIKTAPFPTSGGTGSGAFSKLEWFTGDENAPANGDTVLVHDSFPGKFLDVYRDGIKQPQVYNDTGFYRVNDSTIWVKPPFSSADKFWHIEARDSTAYTQLTLQAPDAPPSTTIAYVGGTDGGNNGGSGTTRTFSHTTSGGSNLILLVGFVGDLTSGNDDVVSVTYNGSAMTLVNKTDNTSRYQYLYYLLNPPSGAHNVVITNTNSHWILAGASEYSGVQGIDGNVTNKHSGGSPSTLTTSLTTTANNCWTVLFMGSGSSTSSAGAGATKRVYDSANFWSWYDSGSAITPAGSHSMTTTTATGSLIGHCMVSLKPY